jgi:hypothetical protein
MKKRKLLVSIVLAMTMICLVPLIAFAADSTSVFADQSVDFERGHSQDGIVPMEVYSKDGPIEMLAVPDDSFQEPFSIMAASSQLFEVVKLVDNGPDSENIVISILGDGFTASEQDYFVNSAIMVSEYLLNFHPFSSFKNKFNVYAVKVISNVSGAAARPTALIDNYFGSTFYFDGVTQRLLYTTYSAKVYEVLNTHTPKYDMPVVIVNSTVYGGGGGVFAVTSLEASAKEILVHELGHSAGGLVDEYWWRGSEAPNMTRDNNAATNKWRHWLGFESVGMYPHAESPTWFRPHQNCEMRYLNRAFCGVCATELTSRMSNIVSEPFYGLSTLTDATIPHGKTRIGDYTYYGSEALATVTIPSTVLTIGRYSFLRCTNLTSVTNYAITPQTINTTTFAGVNRANITLSVPLGTLDAYQAVGWTGFGEVVELAYEVIFVDWDQTVLDTQIVGHGFDAVAPPDPLRIGYTFTGWDIAFDNVTSDLMVIAQYIVTPVEILIEDLNSFLNIGAELGLISNNGSYQSLLSFLINAEKQIAMGKIDNAIKQLENMIDSLAKDAGKKVDADFAGEAIEKIRVIMWNLKL